MALPALGVPAYASSKSSPTTTAKTSTASKASPKASAHPVKDATASNTATSTPPKATPSGGAGVVGPTYPGGSQHLGDRILHQGLKGHDVRVLQGYLTIVGFPVEVSGVFGPVTKARVESFQRSVHMPANGIVTIEVANALRKAVARVEKSEPLNVARINGNGTATPPRNAPQVVRQMITAANQIIDKPYIYGGGHGTWNDSGYDCSGSVSYVLHAVGMLSSPEDSTELESFGYGGKGHWVSVYANADHTWIVIAGRAFDTADFGGPDIPGGSGPRWRWAPTGNLQDGMQYVVRHPGGL